MTGKNLPQSGTSKNNRDGGRAGTAAWDAAADRVRAEIAAEEAAAAAPVAEGFTCRCCGSDVSTPFPVDYCGWCRGGVAGMSSSF